METQLRGCVIGLLVADGVRFHRVQEMRERLHTLGARSHFISLQSTPVISEDGSELVTDVSVGTVTPRYYDGLVIADCRSVTDMLEVDEDALALLQVFADEQRPIAAIGNGVALLADASLVEGYRIAALDEVAGLVADAGGEAVSDEVVADRLITTGLSGCDVDTLVREFADDVRAVRTRDYVDEISNESFPASDAHSGSSASHME